jgi:hypothetical protein
MRRMRLFAALAACISLTAVSASAHEPCGCRERLVLNGQLNTADFDGGVGDRFGGGGAIYGGTTVMVYGNASAGGSAFAAAHASAYARASVSTHIGGGAHGGASHGGGHR